MRIGSGVQSVSEIFGKRQNNSNPQNYTKYFLCVIDTRDYLCIYCGITK